MDFKDKISKCKTDKQVLKAVHDNGFKVVRDNSLEIGSFSIWLDDTTRIYKSSRGYVLQKWQKVKVQYSGIPTFFATGL